MGSMVQLLLLLILSISLPLQAAPTILTTEQWQADIDEMIRLLETRHFHAWAFGDEDTIRAAAAMLKSQAGSLSDSEIIVGMAKIVALLDDGHTRLSLPRQHDELAIQFEYGHSGNEPVADDGLRFRNLPVVFEYFEDGIRVVQALPEHENLVGGLLTRIGNLPADAAIEAVASLAFAENTSANRMWVPDRLALAEVLQAAGIASDPGRIPVVVETGTGRVVRDLIPLADGPAMLAAGRRPPWILPDGPVFSSRFLAGDKALYIRMTEMEFATEDFPADRFARLLAEAEARHAEKIIIDLRHNIGGSSSWNFGIVRALLASSYGDFGSLYVLVGRQTFSAAVLLAQDLEQYLEPVFVGEDVGARPNHFGDANRFTLANSGLTLRVSSRFHPSPWGEDDQRDAIHASLTVPYTYGQYRGEEEDGAIRAAVNHAAPPTLTGRMEWLMRQGLTMEAVFHYFRFLGDPGRPATQEYDALAELGYALLRDGLTEQAEYMFALLAQFHPSRASGVVGLGTVYEASGNTEGAMAMYQAGLDLDPTNTRAKAGLARLVGGQ